MTQFSRRDVLCGPLVGLALTVTSVADGAPVLAAVSAPMPSRAVTVARFTGQKPSYWGFYAPGVLSRFSTATALGRDAVCLTFDACGGSITRYDAELIATLRKYQVPATLFINRRWAMNNVAIFKNLIADPLFQIENHGYTHQPLSVTGRSAYGIKGTASVGAVWDEIASAAQYYSATYKHQTRFMRAGTAFTDDVAARIATFMGQRITSFSINGDAGASYPAATVFSETMKARPGDIVIGHMNHPGGGTAPGFAKAIPALKAKGYRFRHLNDIV